MRRDDEAGGWMQRFVAHEVARHVRTRDAAHWDGALPGLTAEERASRRIRQLLTRGTLAGALAAAGASSAEILSILSDGAAVPGAIPLALGSVAAEALYTTALQIELAMDLASIYGVPFRSGDVGEVSTLIGLSLGVGLVREPTRHDQITTAGDTKPWRVQRQMQRADFSQRVGVTILGQSVLRNVLPIAGVLVSGVWNQLTLRRFARQVHAFVRQRRAIVDALREVKVAEATSARVVLDGAWLLATADSELGHQEALALATLIEALQLPERIAVEDASFSDDAEGWFVRVRELDEAARRVLLQVLAIVAGADGAFTTSERRFLQRLATTLDTRLDLTEIERTVACIRTAELPSNALATAAGSA